MAILLLRIFRISLLFFFEQILAVKENLSSRHFTRMLKLHDGKGGYALAAPGFAHNTYRFPFSDGKAYIPYRFNFSHVGKKRGSQVFHL